MATIKTDYPDQSIFKNKIGPADNGGYGKKVVATINFCFLSFFFLTFIQLLFSQIRLPCGYEIVQNKNDKLHDQQILVPLFQSSIMHHTRGVSTMVGRYPSCMVDTPHVWGVSKIRIPPMYGGYPPYKGGIYHTW